MRHLKPFLKSFTYAFQGLLYVFKYERNARIHLLFAVLVFVLGVYLNVSDVQLAAIFFAVVLVFLAEVINTAFEKTLDLIDTAHNPRIRIVKDMAAASVLVAATAAVIMGFVVFMPYIVRLIWPT
jgi:diacylglycerol kinase (ATP)